MRQQRLQKRAFKINKGFFAKIKMEEFVIYYWKYKLEEIDSGVEVVVEI